MAEPEVVEEEVVPAAEAIPTPEETVEVPEAEIPSVAPELEPVEFPEPAEAPAPELLVTRKLEVPRVEDLPKDPAARLSLARAAFNAGDWADRRVDDLRNAA
ncbi:MAG: hypothetical protein GTN93_28125 [Anaerolineae bacterium]|nr:hypothetical protein [Anaerolineae bacterium]NIQ81877.1 hypothetical protein [Anaerolineae bacterium]